MIFHRLWKGNTPTAFKYIAERTGLGSRSGVEVRNNTSKLCLLTMRKYKKPLPADYTGRKPTQRPSSFWQETDLQNKEPTLLELLEAFAQPGCPICFLAARSVSRHIEAYCRDSVTDVPVRDNLRAANGYCTRHAHQFLDMQDSLAAAITYADILKKMIGVINRAPDREARSSIVNAIRRAFGVRDSRARPLLPERQCPACEEQQVSERRYLTGLIAHLGETAVREVFISSQGLCLIHLPVAVDLADGEKLRTLVNVQRKAWSQLRGHMNEIVRKADYRFTSERITDEERDSLLDVIERIAGKREIR